MNGIQEFKLSGIARPKDAGGMLDDICVALSLLLQHGVSPDALASSMGRLGDGTSPASVIGALTDLIAKEPQT